MADSAAMKSIQRTALIFLLMLSLPAQSLALALSECEQHLTHESTAHNHDVIAEPDCHGASATAHHSEKHTDAQTVATSASDQTQAEHSAGVVCFHCSGACQQSKPLGLDAVVVHGYEIREIAFSALVAATLSGVPAELSRPPCRIS